MLLWDVAKNHRIAKIKFVCLHIHCSKNLKQHFEISDLNTTKIIGVPLDLGQVSVGVSQANSQKRWGENIKAADSMQHFCVSGDVSNKLKQPQQSGINGSALHLPISQTVDLDIYCCYEMRVKVKLTSPVLKTSRRYTCNAVVSHICPNRTAVRGNYCEGVSEAVVWRCTCPTSLTPALCALCYIQESHGSVLRCLLWAVNA